MNRGGRGERDRETDRQSETERHTDTEKETEKDRQAGRQRQRRTKKQTGPGTETQTDTLAERDRPSGVIMRFVHGLVSRAQRTHSTGVLTGGYSASSRLLPPRRYRPPATFLARSLGSWPP